MNLVDGVASSGAAVSDVIVAIENVLGSNFNDVIIGNNAANWLAGHAGNDFIDGYAANDQMFGGDVFALNDKGNITRQKAGNDPSVPPVALDECSWHQRPLCLSQLYCCVLLISPRLCK